MEYVIRVFLALFFSTSGLLLDLAVALLVALVAGYFIGPWAIALGIGAALVWRLFMCVTTIRGSWG